MDGHHRKNTQCNLLKHNGWCRPHWGSKRFQNSHCRSSASVEMESWKTLVYKLIGGYVCVCVTRMFQSTCFIIFRYPGDIMKKSIRNSFSWEHTGDEVGQKKGRQTESDWKRMTEAKTHCKRNNKPWQSSFKGWQTTLGKLSTWNLRGILKCSDILHFGFQLSRQSSSQKFELLQPCTTHMRIRHHNLHLSVIHSVFNYLIVETSGSQTFFFDTESLQP